MSTESNHYGRMVEAVRAWIEHEHPEAEFATVLVELGEEVPPIQVPVTQRALLVSR